MHSRTYGVAGEKGEGYFRALLPLADLLNHAGDEYAPEASFLADESSDAADDSSAPLRNAQMWPPAGDEDNVAWSALDDAGVIAFAATKPLAPGDEATMSYGERSNDHFLMYYGFTPPRNPHDDVVVFQDIEHALSWHMVFHPELWDAGEEDEANARESAARAAVRATGKCWRPQGGALMNAEPRRGAAGRADARLVISSRRRTRARMRASKAKKCWTSTSSAPPLASGARSSCEPTDLKATTRFCAGRRGAPDAGARACPTERTRKKCW